MLPVIWRATARDDLAEIVRYVASKNPPAARRLKRMLEEAILPAAEHPYLYRQSERILGLREIAAHRITWFSIASRQRVSKL